MKTKKDNSESLQGKKPYQYCDDVTITLNKEVYVKGYTLHTDDWFESGTRFAYSLHKTYESAAKYRPCSWWFPSTKVERAYVSKRTLESVFKEDEGLFISMED